MVLTSKIYKFIYLVVICFAIYTSAKTARKLRLSYAPLEEPHKERNERFATTKEIDEQYKKIPESDRFFEGVGGFPISRTKGSLYIDTDPVHHCIIGTSRSGKTQIYSYSIIDNLSRARRILDRASMIITDPKGELGAASKSMLEKRGYRVEFVNLETFDGMGYNPLEMVKNAYMRGDTDEAQLLTNNVSYSLFNDPNSKDKTWQNWSISLTNALILATVIDCCAESKAHDKPEEFYNRINMYSAVRLLVDYGQFDDEDSKCPLDVWFAKRGIDDIARIQYASVQQASGKTKGNIFSNTLAVLIKFTMNSIAKMTSANTLNLEDIGFDENKPVAVFLTIPDYDFSNSFLFTIFIDQLYYALAKKANQTTGKCVREVVFLLDEFGNIPAIPNLAQTFTVCLGRLIKFIIIIQDYSQVVARYGTQAASTILSNCGNHIMVLSGDQDTNSRFSNRLGKFSTTSMSRAGDPLAFDKAYNTSHSEYSLMTPSNLERLQEGETVVLRIMKRRDNKGKAIISYPIHNCEENGNEMKYSYTYLNNTFETEKRFRELELYKTCKHIDLQLSEIIYRPTAINQQESNTVAIPELVMRDVFSIDHFITLKQILQDILYNEVKEISPRGDIMNLSITKLDEFLQKLFDDEKLSDIQYDDIYRLFDIAEQAYIEAQKSNEFIV